MEEPKSTVKDWLKNHAANFVFVCMIVGLFINNLRQESRNNTEIVNFRKEINRRMDDQIEQNQRNYERMMAESRARISDAQGQITIIEKEKPKIYENYITFTSAITDSTITPMFNRAMSEWRAAKLRHDEIAFPRSPTSIP
jgi:hypothetical protein